MASFDLETFLKVKGQTGTGLFQAVGMAFGLPSCLINLGMDVLSILPSNVCAGIMGNCQSAKSKANEITAEVLKKLMLNSGIIEYDTDQGILKFKSISSWFGAENDNKQFMDDLGGLLGAINYAADFAAQIYANYENISNQIQSILDCIGKWKEMQSFQKGLSADQKATLNPIQQEELLDQVYAADIVKLQNAAEFIDKCNKQIRNIRIILKQREADPTLEPCFLDSSELDIFLSGTTYVRCPLDDPGLEIDEKEVFRLTYGPPVSVEGQYVLTSDGLYYDSQTGGLDPIYLAISGIIPPGDKWKYDYDPNLGGKGDAISIKSLNKFTDNIFDALIIDDSLGMQVYYDADHFLSVIIGQRDKHVYDLSSDLRTYINDYGEDSSIVKNQRQLIISQIANHNSKLNRRKKQIEVAIKAPQIYGGVSGSLFIPGDIPINDFSFLDEYNLMVDLEKQKALVFAEAEVVGMVYPIDPKFTSSPPKAPSIGFNHLSVPAIGKGSIIYTPSGVQSGAVLSLTDQIVADRLFAIYNFLETDIVTPSSTQYLTTNCATDNQYNNAKLLSTNKKSVFNLGLSIPYLEGITKNKQIGNTAAASAMGSFLRLPDTDEFRNLTYNPQGMTVEFWVYIPDLMDEERGWNSEGASSLTKVVLGCENVGAMSGVSALDHTGAYRDLDFLSNDKGNQFVRGMLMGFTRDRRITHEGLGYSNHSYNNDTTSSLSFFVAPTQSRDFSSCSWINNDDCQDYETFYKMKVDLSATEFGNVSSQFVLVDLTIDPASNQVSMFANGSLVTTSAIDQVFGVPAYTTPNLPSFKKDNSFEYSSTTVDGPTTLYAGPRLNTFYTPWIVGGGYTDGMYRYGNFMGGDRGGIESGLKGHLASLKFYQKPLEVAEVKANYNAQKGYFKNIDLLRHEVDYETGEGFNIVVLLMDDIGIDHLGIYNSINPIVIDGAESYGTTPFSTLTDSNGQNWYPHTPTLSAIASKGVTFFNTHTAPMCTPTRAAILTGKHAFSSPNYLYSTGNKGYWGHGMGTVSTETFEKSRGGMAGLGHIYPLYSKTGDLSLITKQVKSGAGDDSVWAGGKNFEILPSFIRKRGYQSGMSGKWHLAEWSGIYVYNEYNTDPDIGPVVHASGQASGMGWDHIPSVGKWDRYSAIFSNVNKIPIPNHSLTAPQFDEQFWISTASGSIIDQHQGYTNFFMNKDGDVVTVSDSGYTSFVSSLGNETNFFRPYYQETSSFAAGPGLDDGDASSFATYQTMAEASGMFNTMREPFFLYVPVNTNHSPFTMPPSGTVYNWDAFYDASHVQARIDLEKDPTLKGTAKNNADASAAWINSIAQVECLDYMLSSFLSSCDADRLNRTIIIVMGDNGTDLNTIANLNRFAGQIGNTSGLGPVYTKWLDPNGAGTTYLPNRRGCGDPNKAGQRSKGFKASMYERGTQVPLIVSASFIPSGVSGTTSQAFIDAIDIYATVADIARLKKVNLPLTFQLPKRYEGTSFLPLLTGKGTHTKNFSFSEVFKPIGNSTGWITGENIGTYTGRVGARGIHTTYGDGKSVSGAPAQGNVGDPTIPYERLRAFSVSANRYQYGSYIVSGEDSNANHSPIPAVSAGTWKLIRSQGSSVDISGPGWEELYHLRDYEGVSVDPYELNDLLLPAKVAMSYDTDGGDILQYLLDNSTQTSATNARWILTRIFYAVRGSLDQYLDTRREPFS